ncbi:ig-like domain-containing protein [Nephila pilipes]|uniref:Ig-like domain-containing protein n=1 Tax=Nephila pilipes TaxID=299642 RepID=A0A8X6TDX1_NEPPI|nr:ig-like domain-containing protein [Nephila pilipes]
MSLLIGQVVLFGYIFLQTLFLEKKGWEKLRRTTEVKNAVIPLGRSSNGSVYIRDISHLTAGIFKCEVSADAPSFQTVSAEKSMSVQESAGHAQQEADRSSVNILLLTMLLILQWRVRDRQMKTSEAKDTDTNKELLSIIEEDLRKTVNNFGSIFPCKVPSCSAHDIPPLVGTKRTKRSESENNNSSN